MLLYSFTCLGTKIKYKLWKVLYSVIYIIYNVLTFVKLVCLIEIFENPDRLLYDVTTQFIIGPDWQNT